MTTSPTGPLAQAAAICDALAMLYPREDVGFDTGYRMGCQRAARDIRALAGRSTSELATRLRSLAKGRVEWRVQHPVEHCYCISFDRSDSLNPEREAREWLADFRKRFPHHEHAKYEVAQVRVFNELEEAAVEAADALDAAAATTGKQPSIATTTEDDEEMLLQAAQFLREHNLISIAWKVDDLRHRVAKANAGIPQASGLPIPRPTGAELVKQLYEGDDYGSTHEAGLATFAAAVWQQAMHVAGVVMPDAAQERAA